jgi:hypothetical protein
MCRLWSPIEMMPENLKKSMNDRWSQKSQEHEDSGRTGLARITA